MSDKTLALILAAGEGTRMRSLKPKVLHEVAHLPLVCHVMRVSDTADCDRLAIVVGSGSEAVSEAVKSENPNAEIFIQQERLGTAHAVLSAREAIESRDNVLVLFGDTPLLRTETLKKLKDELESGAAVAVAGFMADDPEGYGRLLVKDGKLLAIREHKEATDEERKVNFCNAGIMGLNGEHALELLDAVDNKNSKGEFYLTDVVEIANTRGLVVTAIEAAETEVLGVDNRKKLAQAESLWQANHRIEVLDAGVTMHDPETVYFSNDTVIEPDVTLEPNQYFGPGVIVRSGAEIKAFCHFEGAEIGENAVIGPFARLRPGTDLAEDTKVGNFVEVKNAKVAEGAKLNHLTYIGDAEIGSKANIGAGTITCNYDGMNKHKTVIGANAFIGSNSALVAPVTIGDGAYVGSGSVITDDIPDDDMGVARGRQINKEGYAAKIRERNAAHKAERSKS